ncbi:MAG: type II secretion system protein [bacterium]
MKMFFPDGRNTSRGFTLIELLVVVMIIGVLVAFAVPSYLKSIEVSKASGAAGMAHTVGVANRMYTVDNYPKVTQYLSGPVSDSCNSIVCPDEPASNVCELVACNYMAKQRWIDLAYEFYACNGTSGGGCCGTAVYGAFAVGEDRVACARRKSTVSGCGGLYTKCSSWGFASGSAGTCLPFNTTENPGCPSL